MLVEDTLIDDHMKNMRIARDKKVAKCHGILRLIEPCSHVLEVNFPLQKDDGSYEMINGYRAQHSHHRLVIMILRPSTTSLSILSGPPAREVSATPWTSALTR